MTPDRFFSLLLALRTREAVTTPDLAAQLGVSVRTVLRDLRWLEDAGFPLLIQRGRWGGVTLLPGGPFDTARLTPEERDHLALYGLDDAQREQLGAAGGSRRAHRKVGARLGPAPGGGALPLSAVVTTDNRPWFFRDAEGQPPAALVADVRRGVRLRIRYRSARDAEASWRVVDPYGLLAKAGRWYLVADAAGRPRLYALERLAGWEPLRAARRLRDGATLRGVAAELTERWENPDAYPIHALIDADQRDRARRILGRQLTVEGGEGGEGGEGERGGDGSGRRPARLRITVRGRSVEDVRRLLAFGATVTVTGPPEARERMRQLAAEILRAHS
ncbi:helix-turn-helix transcriptional regulator [Streptomyces harbinensis]|uniref:helix-turn-helix transcriptional regulator n=2 Tax=Streptomyces harbinensis TaxID=1176198 RepID=UPI00372170FF